MGDPRAVAVIWHQVGRVHEDAGQLDAAEDAYRRALALRVREADLAGQADTLNQLGNLYAEQDRLEESIAFLRSAVDIFARSGDRAKEGIVRSNLGRMLVALRRYDEARTELGRAVECKDGYGHAVQPWQTWSILADLEAAGGHDDAARAARLQAVETYRAYRRDGGRSRSRLAEVYAAAARTVDQDERDAMARQLDDLLGSGVPSWATAPVSAVRAVLAGRRATALADDPQLDPIEAAELLLLLDRIEHGEPEPAVPRVHQLARATVRSPF
jgi:tetratricopeptide (TPR) repeat protein